jgi:hypothetical protein
MKITYYVDDGYAGSRSRPQTCKVDDGDIEGCETQEEFEELINAVIEDDFRNKISYIFTMPPRPTPNT